MSVGRERRDASEIPAGKSSVVNRSGARDGLDEQGASVVLVRYCWRTNFTASVANRIGFEAKAECFKVEVKAVACSLDPSSDDASDSWEKASDSEEERSTSSTKTSGGRRTRVEKSWLAR